ncbi:MAG: DUF4186 domain-containing protein [Lentisphaeria bacterium]|nr:DUF4186 domain-containing protein [Lentisphaeria bacterium]
MAYAEMKERFAASAFRSRFRLSPAERAYVAEKGLAVIRAQAEKIVRERLAPARPAADGRQTPMRGHAVFKAQHGTATCCRSCLQKWHGIPAGRALGEAEIAYVADMIADWIADRAGDLSEFPRTPELFG